MLDKIQPDIILMDEFQWIDKFEVNRFTEEDLSNILGDLEYVRGRNTSHFLNTEEGSLLIEYVNDVLNDGINSENNYQDLKPSHFLKALPVIQNNEDKELFLRFARAWHSFHQFEYYENNEETAIIPNYKTPIEYILEETEAKMLIVSMSKFQKWMLEDYLASGGGSLSVDLSLHPNEESQLIICDSASRPLMFYISQERYNQFNEEIEIIAKIVKKFPYKEDVLLFAPNIKVINTLKNNLDGTVRSIESFDDVKEGKESGEALLDYARSSTSGGIEIGRRFGLLINYIVPKRKGYIDEQSIFHVKMDKCMETARGLCGS